MHVIKIFFCQFLARWFLWLFKPFLLTGSRKPFLLPGSGCEQTGTEFEKGSRSKSSVASGQVNHEAIGLTVVPPL